MKNKKVMALILAAAMAAGSSATVFAADAANSAESEGTSFEHVNKDVIDVTLPTDTAVATVFDYYVDPEGAIKSAGTLLDGTAVTGNDDGVYFVNAGAAATAGTVSSSIAADTNSDYVVTVSDMNTNETYTYDGSDWKDSTNNTTTVTISVMASDGTTSGTLANGDTVTVSGATAAGSAGYSSSSDAVKFEGKNSVDVDVTVAAAVTATDADKDIALVADQDALDAATGPALLMTLKVGSDEKVITSAGATAKATIAGVAGNFTTKPNDDGSKFVFALKDAADLSAWNSTTVQLVGKTNDKDIPTGANAMTVPKITLTWTVAKHVSGPSAVVSPSGLITVSDLNVGDTAVTVLGATIVAEGVDETALNSRSSTWDVTAAQAKIQLSDAWVELLDGKEATVKINLSDGKSIVVKQTIAK